jgi:hypothetical protein
MRRNPWITAIGTALLASACATATPPPTNALVESRAAVRIAEQNGAEHDVRAAQYLALARQQIADAERFTREGSNWSARQRLQQAQVNAEMAGELARQAHARAEAEATQREIQDLRSRTPQ